MVSSRRRLAVAGAVLLAALIVRAEDTPPGGDAKMPREPERPAVPDEAKPTPSVTITKKEYQDLLDRLARLEGPARAEPPSTCKVSGRVAGDLAHLRAEFDFQTGPGRARVALGCAQAYPTEAKIDNHPPILRWGADGLSALVDDAGDHHLVLELDLPLVPRERGADRGLDLDLPAAVTTTLELELPPGVKKAQLRTSVRGEGPLGKPPAPREVKTEAPAKLKTAGLGPVERLELTWEGQALAAGPVLFNVASSRVFVRVDEREAATHAEIALSVRRGQLKEFQILVPAKATVRGPEGDEREVRVEPAQGPLRTVHLKPTTDPLTLTIDVPHQRSAGPIPVGPFVVLGTFPQGGDILVTGPADRTLEFHARGESQYRLIQREPTVGEKGEGPTLLALHYTTLPGAGVEKGEPSPFLELEVRPLAAVLAAGVTHALRLVRGEGDAPGAWHVTTTILAQVSNAEIEHLRVALPPEFRLDEGAGVQPNGDAQAVLSDQGRELRFDLTPRRRGKFNLTFEGQYTPAAVPAGNGGEMAVSLPRLLDRKSDRGAVVSVELPRDLELIAPARPGPFWESGEARGPNKRSWTPDHWPDRVEIAWRPYRPALIVNGDVRITLMGRQASVSHRLWLPAGQAVPEQMALNVPREVIGLTVVGEKDGTPPREGKDGVPTVPVAAPADREHPVVLSYSFRLPEPAAGPIQVPIVWPRAATGGETRVCVWGEPGMGPQWNDGRWQVRRTEEVKDVNSYPSLVLASHQPGASLALDLGNADGIALAAFRVDRVLIQATVGESGQQIYRARFRLSQVAATTIDVALPQPLFRHNPDTRELSVLVGGRLAAWRPVDEAGKEAAVSPTARVQLPADLAGKSGVLEVNYTLLPGRSVLQSLLQAPQLRGDPGAAQVRWQVALPLSWVPLSQDALGPEYGWGRRGWLFALRPTVTTADFESWFAGTDPAAADAGKWPDPSVAVWRSSPEPLRLSHVPEQPWLLVCSLTLLIVGLSLAFVSLPRPVFWGTLAALGVGALLAGLFWPGVLGAILYGCQPGLLVLLPVLAVQWVAHQRYRRRVVFLPGFKRLKAGSSLTRGSGSRPRGEPSTVDAAPPVSGSQKPQADS
jgi:hypothetical protein